MPPPLATPSRSPGTNSKIAQYQISISSPDQTVLLYPPILQASPSPTRPWLSTDELAGGPSTPLPTKLEKSRPTSDNFFACSLA